jgi:hypothetical protein
MEINSALNFVIPIRLADDGEPLVWAYHTPISTEVFQTNYRIIAETNARIWGKGLKYAATAGARVAALTLLDVAKDDAREYDTPDQGQALLAEIRRLTIVLAPALGAERVGPTGFQPFPVDVAIQRRVVDREDWEEVQAAIVFFTVGYAMSKRAKRAAFCEHIASLIGGSTTPLKPMEFAASLLISTPAEPSAEPEPSLATS